MLQKVSNSAVFSYNRFMQPPPRRVLTLRNIFLYFAVVVLPILVGTLALANMVEEQYLAGVETAKQDLDLQSARPPFFYRKTPDSELRCVIDQRSQAHRKEPADDRFFC
jgi:hypothetical protein